MPACHTVGWVLADDTSTRRLQVHLLPGGAGIGVTMETGPGVGQTVVLDVDGATYLHGLLVEAVQRLLDTAPVHEP